MGKSKYAEVLNEVVIKMSDGDSAKIERLIIKKTGNTEIRFSWWTQECKQFQHAALDLSEDDLLKLMEEAIKNKVFSNDFTNGLLKILK